MFAQLLSLLLVTTCACGAPIPNLTQTVRGSHPIGEHVMIYGDHEDRFVWGIVFSRDNVVSMSDTDAPEPTATIELESGIVLSFVKNEVTFTKDAKTVTMILQPQTVYFMQDDLSAKPSADLSGIKFVPKRVWNRWVNAYDVSLDLELPENLPKRFGKSAF